VDLKINQNIFRTVCFSGTKNLPYRDSSTRLFNSDFFFMNRPDFTAKYAPKIAEVKLSSCGLEVTDLRTYGRLRNCGVAVAEQHFFKSCGIAIAEVLPSSCVIVIACPPLPFSR
jgi:hypothetical protein